MTSQAFLFDHILNRRVTSAHISHLSGWPTVLMTTGMHKSIPPPSLNHNLPLVFISQRTGASSARSNKQLNPAPHSWEVKPGLSSDSSRRSCAKSSSSGKPVRNSPWKTKGSEDIGHTFSIRRQDGVYCHWTFTGRCVDGLTFLQWS